MDVYVIPTAPDSYELYCEVSALPEAGRSESGLIGRWRRKISAVIHAAEERRQQGNPAAASGSWRERTQERAIAWAAERIAEQRLLWNLQNETAITLVHPDDISTDQALTLVQRMLRRDFERHKRWMVVDGLAFIFTFIVLGPLFFIIPGIANLPALYFGFRTVGHWFSTRGAAQGIHRVAWTGTPSSKLSELRIFLDESIPGRDASVRDIAAHHGLQHLATFFDRVAVTRARG